jgi:Insertion element 4 transposase N-terminal/Transposase DDE domain
MPESATLLPRSAGVSSSAPAAGSSPTERGLPLRLGVLTEQVPPALVDDVVAPAGGGKRRCRLLPDHTVVYFVLGLCLFSGADSMAPPGYRTVMRWLTNGLRHLPGIVVPTSPALTKARKRLGPAPLAALFDRVRGPVGGAGTRGVVAFGRRVVAWDGTGVDVADTEVNAAAFGRAGVAGHPQLRLLALIECGTHALIDAVFDGFHLASEHALARGVLPRLRPGMLLLADRNFPGHQLWGEALATGADLVWRLKKNQVFVPTAVLPDGSFLSVMGTPAENVRYGQARAAGRPLPGPPIGHIVRIVEYTVTVSAADGSTRVEPFRLVTSLLDDRLAPADQIAALYHQRWEIELGYGELKCRLRGAEFILRSRSPELVCQEMHAFLVVYQALAGLRTHTAQAADLEPARISFTVTVRLARDQVCNQAGADPHTLAAAVEQTIADLIAETLPGRRDRSYERIKRPPKNTFPTKKPDHIRACSRVDYTLTVIEKQPPDQPIH